MSVLSFLDHLGADPWTCATPRFLHQSAVTVGVELRYWLAVTMPIPQRFTVRALVQTTYDTQSSLTWVTAFGL